MLFFLLFMIEFIFWIVVVFKGFCWIFDNWVEFNISVIIVVNDIIK